MGLQNDPKSLTGLKIKFRLFYKKYLNLGSAGTLVTIWIVLSPIIFLSILIPNKAEAGVFSFISSLFSFADAAEAEEIFPNSQNIALLQAVISPNQDATSTGEAISIIGGNSISAETFAPTDTKTLDDDQISLYVVHSGDTLPAIAKMFGVSVNTIKWSNDLTGNTITAGQTLVILPISGIQHIVKKGDTLESIAKLHKGDLTEILQYNGLNKDSKLSIGDVIVVPDGEAISVSSGIANSGAIKTSSSYPVYEGYYMRPIIGGIKTQGIHGHNGVDLASSYGSNILASASGDVIISRNFGWNGGYGFYIVVRHSNGTQTLYAHLSATLVSAGDHVTQGQVIGKMGHSGQVRGYTGTHLHFEIRGARNPF